MSDNVPIPASKNDEKQPEKRPENSTNLASKRHIPWGLIASVIGVCCTIASAYYARVSGLEAERANDAAERHHNDNLKAAELEDARNARAEFLSLLEQAEANELMHHQVTVEYQQSTNLGSMQNAVTERLKVLLLRAEELIPRLTRQPTETEHLILAKGFQRTNARNKAKQFAIKATASADPQIRADALCIIAACDLAGNNKVEGRAGFEQAIKVFKTAAGLWGEDRIAGQVQVCVTWCELEADYGTDEWVEKVMKRGREYADQLRDGSLRDSGIKFFNSAACELKKRRFNAYGPMIGVAPVAATKAETQPQPIHLVPMIAPSE